MNASVHPQHECRKARKENGMKRLWLSEGWLKLLRKIFGSPTMHLARQALY